VTKYTLNFTYYIHSTRPIFFCSSVIIVTRVHIVRSRVLRGSKRLNTISTAIIVGRKVEHRKVYNELCKNDDGRPGGIRVYAAQFLIPRFSSIAPRCIYIAHSNTWYTLPQSYIYINTPLIKLSILFRPRPSS